MARLNPVPEPYNLARYEIRFHDQTDRPNAWIEADNFLLTDDRVEFCREGVIIAAFLLPRSGKNERLSR
jgi:hypothetical protein